MAALSIVSEIRRDLGHIVSDFQRLPGILVVLKLFLRFIAANRWRTWWDTCFTESVWWASSFGLFDILWNNFDSNNELRLVYDTSKIKANHAWQHYQISSLFSLHPFTLQREPAKLLFYSWRKVSTVYAIEKIVYYNKYLSQDINKVILQLNI